MEGNCARRPLRPDGGHGRREACFGLERMLEAKAGASKEDKIRLLQEALARLGGIPETVEPTEQSVSGPPDEGTLLRSQSQPDNPTGQTEEGAVTFASEGGVGYDKGAAGIAEAGRSPD